MCTLLWEHEGPQHVGGGEGGERGGGGGERPTLGYSGASASCDVEMETGVGGKCFPRRALWRPALGLGCPGVGGAQTLKKGFCSEPALHSRWAHIPCGKSLEENDVEALNLGGST